MYCPLKQSVIDLLSMDVMDEEPVFLITLTRHDVRSVTRDLNLSDSDIDTVMKRLDAAFENGADVILIDQIAEELVKEQQATRNVTERRGETV
ncbi:DNA methylase [Salmonella enterica subsp. enterica]